MRRGLAAQDEQWALEARCALMRRFRELEPVQAALGITDRQMQVLLLMHGERANKEIALILGVSMRAVELMRASLLQRLGVRTSIGAVLKLERALQLRYCAASQ